VLLIDIARTGGNQRDCGLAARAGLDVMPASFRVRQALAMCRLPRWGGSHKLVQAIANRANPFVVDNPRLAALHGYVDWDLGRESKGDEALGLLSTALNYGDDTNFYHERGRVHATEKRYAEALVDYDLAAKMSPDRPAMLVDRLYALAHLGKRDEVDAVVELVETIDPMNDDLPKFKEFSQQLERYQDEVESLKGQGESIEQLTHRLNTNNGRNQVTYYWRGRAYLKAGDNDNALADFEQSIQLDPTFYDSYLNIDFILARRGDWTGVVDHWNAYLLRKPSDAKAIFERAGALHHGGREAESQADVKKACELGLQAACSQLKKQ
jgi:tetratricopeptide (TPR) repeat protein